MAIQNFARIENGEIKETTLTEEMIRNRAHPLRLSETHYYAPIVKEPMPSLKWDETVKQEYQILGESVKLSFKVVKKSIQEQLNYIFKTFGNKIESSKTGPLAFQREEYELPSISAVDPQIAQEFMFNLGNEVTAKLEAFVKTRNYDSVVSCLSYLNDDNPVFQAEAMKVKNYRSSIWQSLLNKQQEIMTGATPLPKSAAEVFAWIPEFTWD